VLPRAMAVAQRDPQVAEAHVEPFAAVRAAIVAMVGAAQDARSIDSVLDPGEAAWLLQGVLLAGLLRGAIRDDGVAAGAASVVCGPLSATHSRRSPRPRPRLFRLVTPARLKRPPPADDPRFVDGD